MIDTTKNIGMNERKGKGFNLFFRHNEIETYFKLYLIIHIDYIMNKTIKYTNIIHGN